MENHIDRVKSNTKDKKSDEKERAFSEEGYIL